MEKRERIDQAGVSRGKEEGTYPVFSVDAFADGITFERKFQRFNEDPRDAFSLHIPDDFIFQPLKSKYALRHHASPITQLELQLRRLSEQGILARSMIFLGHEVDPFIPFEGRFDISMKFLELFERFTPGHLVVQTRSPLIVIGLPVLKRMGKRVSVTIGIESHLEESTLKYTPGLPRVEERLKAATALRRFGIEVTLQVAPILPYGEWKKDAVNFARVLLANGDYIHALPFLRGNENSDKPLKNHSVITKLAEDRKFHWLRPDAAHPLLQSIELLAPHKLVAPQRESLKDKQLEIFAA